MATQRKNRSTAEAKLYLASGAVDIGTTTDEHSHAGWEGASLAPLASIHAITLVGPGSSGGRLTQHLDLQRPRTISHRPGIIRLDAAGRSDKASVAPDNPPTTRHPYSLSCFFEKKRRASSANIQAMTISSRTESQIEA